MPPILTAIATGARFAISEAEIEIPELRIWTARVAITTEDTLAKGIRVRLDLGGGLVLVGTIIASGTHAGITRARIVGGAGGWRLAAPKDLSYQNDGGLFDTDLARSLGVAMGETVEANKTPELVGVHWSFDPETSAGRNLEDLGPWYVRNDGVTVFGPRPEGAEFRAIVPDYDGAEPKAVIEVDEQDLGKFAPLMTIVSDAIAEPIRVQTLTICMYPKRLTVEVEGFEPNADRVMQAIEARGRLFGAYPYRVIEQIGQRLQLQAITKATGLPSQALVEKPHGLPGAETIAAGGGEVLVVFEGGSRARPKVVAYLGNSLATTLRSLGQITFSGTEDVPTPQPIALAPPVSSFAADVSSFAAAVATFATAAATALPALEVPASAVQAKALVLATTAAKVGAPSSAGGAVSIRTRSQ